MRPSQPCACWLHLGADTHFLLNEIALLSYFCFIPVCLCGNPRLFSSQHEEPARGLEVHRQALGGEPAISSTAALRKAAGDGHHLSSLEPQTKQRDRLT